MTIWLTGFMGSGKSTVGRALARRLGRPFIDLDREIERREGRTISAIFAESGEALFRDAERRALLGLSTDAGPVVATGGGIVIDPQNRQLMDHTGLRIWLNCPPAELQRRLASDSAAGVHRPLWRSDPEELANLLEQRSAAYAEAALVLDATAATEVTVQAIIDALPA